MAIVFWGTTIKKDFRAMERTLYPKKEDWEPLLRRPTQNYSEIENLVEKVFGEIQRGGDAAIKKYTDRFDQVKLEDLSVGPEEIERAAGSVPKILKESILLAKTNIEKFHAAQRTRTTITETMPGVLCWQEKKPIQKVGLYIPGGTAPLFSTVLMLAVPAQLAGCRDIILCTPP